MGDILFYENIGKTIIPYYETGMLFFLTGNTSFILSYIFFDNYYKYEYLTTKSLIINNKPEILKKAYNLFIILSIIIFLDLILSGVDPLAFILGDSDVIIMASQSITGTYYLRNFADSIITILLILYALGERNYKFYIVIALSFILFTLMGFRYRIILTLLGIAIISYTSFAFKKINPIRLTILLSITIYIIFFITYNRWYIAYGLFDEVVYNPIEYKIELIFEQTRASLADINLLRYYDQNPDEPFDYGESMFVYIFIKIVPKQFFELGIKPYPPPFVALLEKALELPATYGKTGEASTHYGAFYNALGWWGILLFPIIMSLCINWFTRRNSSSNLLGLLKQVCLALCLFQFITRGYFPQFVDHYVYIFVPLWLLTSILKKS